MLYYTYIYLIKKNKFFITIHTRKLIYLKMSIALVIKKIMYINRLA